MARRRILPLFIPHLGCPHHCVFCDQRQISGQLSPVTPEIVAKTLEKACAEDTEPFEVAFYGGSFTALPLSEQSALLSAVQPYCRSGAVSSIRLSTRPDAITDQVLELLAENHVETVELGAQSMSDAVLSACCRGHSAEDTRRAARALREHGFQLVLQMMTGLPGSTPEAELATAKEFAALSPDAVRIYPAVVLRGTALAALWERGEYRAHSIEDAVSICALLLPLFRAAGIPVIRLGLNPSETLAEQVLAGAYHPALGELVYSRIYLALAREKLTGAPINTGVIIYTAPGETSKMTGQHRCSLRTLQAEFRLSALRVRESAALRPGELQIEFDTDRQHTEEINERGKITSCVSESIGDSGLQVLSGQNGPDL